MVRELREMIRNGVLGDLNQIHVEMPQETFARSGVNLQAWRQVDYSIPTVSLDLGVHVYHLLGFLTDNAKVMSKELKEFSAFNSLGVVDNVYAWADLSGGITFAGWWGKTSLGYRNGLRVRVFGSKGSAEWEQSKPEYLTVARSDGGKEIIERGREDLLICNAPRYNRFKPGHPAGFVEAFANLYLDFHDTLNENAINDYVADIDHTEECLSFLTRG
jgi:predicted dehydrogenase